MEKVASVLKPTVITVGAFLSAKFGQIYPIFLALIFAMILDYFTGILAGAINGQLSSKVGAKGILKKLCYVIEVAVAITLDYAITYISNKFGYQFPVRSMFSSLICIWLILNNIKI